MIARFYAVANVAPLFVLAWALSAMPDRTNGDFSHLPFIRYAGIGVAVGGWRAPDQASE